MHGGAIVQLQNAFWQAARKMVTFHTTPWELDEALSGWGYGMGPCEAMDLLGLEKVLARQSAADAVPVLERMVTEGRIGKAGSVGFYRYPGGGGAVIDPLIEDLIIEEVRFAGLTRVEWAGDALIEAMNRALSEAAARNEGLDARDMAELLTTAVHFPNAWVDVIF